MSSENEILRSKIALQEKQIRVMRAALSGREELLACVPQDGSIPDPKWLLLFRRQLKEQAQREMQAANADTNPTTTTPALDPLSISATPFTVEPPTVTVSEMTPAYPSTLCSDPESAASCVATLLGTTRQLVEVWQDALRERFRTVLVSVAQRFEAFKRQQSDAALQTLLGSLNDMLPEITTLISDAPESEDDFSGASGNPFMADDAALESFFVETFDKHCKASTSKEVAKVRSEQNRSVDTAVSQCREENEIGRQRLGEAERRLREVEGQRDTLHNDVAKWKQKYDALHESAVIPAAPVVASVPRRAPSVSGVSTTSSVRQHAAGGGGGSQGRRFSGISGRSRSSVPAAMSPLPCSTQQYGEGGGGGGAVNPRVGELRAALGHLEAQLAAACNSSGGAMAQRHGHIRRRMDSVRTALAEEERRGPRVTV